MSLKETIKVTRNYQITIPATIREAAGIKQGEYLTITYDQKEKTIKIFPRQKEKRLTIRLGRKLTPEEIENAIEEYLDEATS